KQHRDLEDTVEKFRQYRALKQGIADAKAMLLENDADMKAMAEEELAQLEPQLAKVEEEIKVLLLPKDPNDDKNIIIELRAGTGGDEASLFVPKLKKSTSRSKTKISASTPSAPPAPVASPSTRLTPRSASRTFPRTQSSVARTRSRKSRTAKKPCAFCARAFTKWKRSGSINFRPKTASSRSAPATAAKRSAPTTSPRTASPTTASASPTTTSRW